PSESDDAGTDWASLGQLRYSVRDPDGAGGQGAPFRIDGQPITLTDLFAAETSITVAGDFSAFDFSNFYGGVNGVFAPDDMSVTYEVGPDNTGCCGYVYVENNTDSIIQA